jgi:transposase
VVNDHVKIKRNLEKMNMNLFQSMKLVPENHLLRLIDKHIDLSFILEKTQPYYSVDKGRLTDPLILFKMMFIGYIHGIVLKES